MSAHALATPPVRPVRSLQGVSSTRQRASKTAVPKLRYIVVTLAGIFAILGAQLMLSIAVSGGAYEIAGLKAEVRNSSQQLQVVAEDIKALSSPDTLATLATSIGMVADNNPAYLRLSDGVVLGEAVPAVSGQGGQVFAVTAGTETEGAPAIVNTVFESVTSVAATGAVGDSQVASAEAPVVTTASAPVAPVVVSDSTPRFGGTIPSPQTR
jgi:cell division protein FtsL